MADEPVLPDEARIPEARIEPRAKRSLRLVWLIPAVAAAVGLWIGVKTYLDQGPVITISFKSADGIEAGKTRIRYKEVELGKVKTVVLAADRGSVLVTAELSPQAGTAFKADDTRFWVVRPRFAGGNVSGLGTLLSGSYIAVDPGQAEAAREHFVGLEKPPIVTADVPGRNFKLSADDMGSIEVGSPLFYRRVPVGQVVSVDLAEDGKSVNFGLFVFSPYEQFVSTATRFWNASGVDLSISADGLRLRTESAASILFGGLAFETPPGIVAAQAEPNRGFKLFSDRVAALQRADGYGRSFVMLFDESVRGLQVGAPVDLRGIEIGEVTRVGIDYDAERKHIRNRVEVRIYPDRLLSRRVASAAKPSTDAPPQIKLADFVARGFRAQLRSGNLVTGQLYVAIDRFPNDPKRVFDDTADLPEVPTVAGTFGEVQQSLASIAKKLDRIPFEEISADLRRSLADLNTLLKSADRTVQRVDTEMLPELRAVISQSRKTIEAAEQTLAADAPLQSDLRQTLRDVSRATEAVRRLADTLERHPESLLRGKPESTP